MSRKNESTGVAIVELTALLPWWGGVMLAVASYGGLHWYVSRPLTSPGSLDVGAMVVQALFHALPSPGSFSCRSCSSQRQSCRPFVARSVGD